MADITRIKNLGPACKKFLAEIDIYSAEELEEIGAMGAYLKLCALHGKFSLNFLYAAWLGLQGRGFFDISAAEKEMLKTEVKIQLENLSSKS